MLEMRYYSNLIPSKTKGLRCYCLYIACTQIKLYCIPGPPGGARAVTPTLTAQPGDTRTLECDVTDPGNPRAEFLWSRDGHGELTGQGTDGTLEMTFTDRCMAGTYRCTPVNDVGEGTSDTVNVILTGDHYYNS